VINTFVYRRSEPRFLLLIVSRCETKNLNEKFRIEVANRRRCCSLSTEAVEMKKNLVNFLFISAVLCSSWSQQDKKRNKFSLNRGNLSAGREVEVSREWFSLEVSLDETLLTFLAGISKPLGATPQPAASPYGKRKTKIFQSFIESKSNQISRQRTRSFSVAN
jgi:hypothetical protein